LSITRNRWQRHPGRRWRKKICGQKKRQTEGPQAMGEKKRGPAFSQFFAKEEGIRLGVRVVEQRIWSRVCTPKAKFSPERETTRKALPCKLNETTTLSKKDVDTDSLHWHRCRGFLFTVGRLEEGGQRRKENRKGQSKQSQH